MKAPRSLLPRAALWLITAAAVTAATAAAADATSTETTAAAAAAASLLSESSSLTSSSTTTLSLAERVLAWIAVQPDTTVHEAVEVRIVGEEDKNVTHPTKKNYGLFVNASIPADTVLMHLPLSLFWQADPVSVNDTVHVAWNEVGEFYSAQVLEIYDHNGSYWVQYDVDDSQEVVSASEVHPAGLCGLTRTVAWQLQQLHQQQSQQQQSQQQQQQQSQPLTEHPYHLYLQSLTFDHIPSQWSKSGQEHLNDLLRHRLPPYDWNVTTTEPCYSGSSNSDHHDHDAYYIALTRHLEHVGIVPGLDFLNHANRPNVVIELSEHDGVTVRAAHALEPHTQLVRSYQDASSSSSSLQEDEQDSIFDYGMPELLRDYGFVDLSLPQVWTWTPTPFRIQENGRVEWHPTRPPPSLDEYQFLQGQLERLQQIDTTTQWKHLVPHEAKLLTDYRQALVHALNAAVQDNSCHDGSCYVANPYRSLFEDKETWMESRPVTCDYGRLYGLENWQDIEEMETLYQSIRFSYNPMLNDTCFELDGTIQICDSYRPVYHEMAVHFPARFLPSVKRVLFVGGGDSMILHDVLKYKSLELVVGLELDQQVTRLSFKYFGTQPHFDDDRVEWWFGDATKSLLMLPRQYYGSFDLVIVDLSETVMALTVTDELDVMRALSLLVKPEGIVVKNEFMYLLSQSSVFQHNLHLHFYGVPVVCSQSLILSSNGVDFLRDPMYEHNVDHLCRWAGNESNWFEIANDYQRNDTIVERFCKPSDASEPEPTVQLKSPGILFIVDAESTEGDLASADFVQECLLRAADQVGLRVVSTVVRPFNDTGVAIVAILKEGYISARTWPEHRYCAFDIHFWGSFDKHKATKDALVAAIGSEVKTSISSAYRVVAGGVFGVDTWKHDQMSRGPHAKAKCDASVRESKEQQAAATPEHARVALEELLRQFRGGESIVAVLCGNTEPCLALNVAQTMSPPLYVLPLTCRGIDESVEYQETGVDLMRECEELLYKTVEEATANGKLHTVILDSSAPYALAQIGDRLLNSELHALHWFGEFAVYAVIHDSKAPWRKVFVEALRTENPEVTSIFSASASFHGPEVTFHLAVSSVGDKLFVEQLVRAIGTIEERTNLKARIHSVRGEQPQYQENFVAETVFKNGDFDFGSRLAQWRSQKPLALQTVFQFETDYWKQEISTDVLEAALATADAHVESVGDGCIAISIWRRGTVVVLWDGRSHLDVNLLTADEDFELADQFESNFKDRIHGLTTKLRDEQPRGIGRLVTFLGDLTPHPHWEPGHSLAEAELY